MGDKIEFSLTIKRSVDTRSNAYGRTDDEPKWEEVETLEYQSFTAKDVIRKILDYLDK